MNFNHNANFLIEIDGIATASIQSITVPEVGYNVLMAGRSGNRPDIKLTGKKNVSEGSIEKLVSSTLPDSPIWALFSANESGLTEVYKKDVILVELGVNKQPINRFMLEGFFISNIAGTEYDTRGDNNSLTLRNITFQVDDYIPL